MIGTLPYSSLREDSYLLFFESEVSHFQYHCIYSMLIRISPIKLEREKGGRESLKQEFAASGQLIDPTNPGLIEESMQGLATLSIGE